MASDAAAATGGIALLERAVNYALGAVHLVTVPAFGWPTPCRGWTVAMLLDHLDDSLLTLIGAVSPVPVSQPTGGRDRDRLGAVRAHAGELVGAWTCTSTPTMTGLDGSSLTGVMVAGAGAIEVAVHGWDVARACGGRQPIPSSLAEEMLDLAVLLVTDRERPSLFAAPVPVPVAAAYSDRLVAYLGRDPS